MRRIVSFLILFFLPAIVGAEIYLCNGTYTDAPTGEDCIRQSVLEQRIERPEIPPEIPKVDRPVKPVRPSYRESAEQNSGRTASADVVRVIDGDTIEVKVGGRVEKVRYIGIDCPESSQEWGKQATEKNKDLARGSVTLEFDVQERDRYGRLLAYVWSGSTMINEALVEEGLAMIATYPPNVKYVDRFRKAQEYARSNGNGFWKDGGLKESPYQYRKSHRRRW